MSARLVIGSGVDSTPDQFTFSDVTGATPSTTYTSATVTVTGLSPNIQITVNASGGTVDTGTSVLSGSFASSQTVTTSASGTFVMAARVTSSSSFSTEVSVTVTINGVSDTYNVTTAAQDTTPDSFTFTNQTGTAKSSYIESNIVTVTGITGSVTVSASGNSGQVSVDGGGYTSSTTITNGQSLRVRVLTGSGRATAYSTTVTLGTYSTSFSATTADISINWTSLGSVFNNQNYFYDYIQFANNQFIVYSAVDNKIYTSTNMISWSATTPAAWPSSGGAGTISGLTQIVYASGKYFAKARTNSDREVILSSTNLVNWTLALSNTQAGYYINLVSNGTEIAASGGNPGTGLLRGFYTTGGATTFNSTTSNDGLLSQSRYSYYANGYYIYIIGGGNVFVTNNIQSVAGFSSSGGTSVGAGVTDRSVSYFAYGNGVAVIGGSSTIYYSSNFTSWNSVSIASGGVMQVAFASGEFYALGRSNRAIYRSTNGSSWTNIGGQYPVTNAMNFFYSGSALFGSTTNGGTYYYSQ